MVEKRASFIIQGQSTIVGGEKRVDGIVRCNWDEFLNMLENLSTVQIVWQSKEGE